MVPALALLCQRLATNPDGSPIFPVALALSLYGRSVLVALGTGLVGSWLSAFTAEENVYLPLLGAAGHFAPQQRDRARELLARIGLEGFETRLASQLSDAQQQRVAIVRALAMNPALVLADEPTGNLDQASGQQAFQLMRRFNCESGTAFLLVTHAPALTQRCDRILTLMDGLIVAGDAGQQDQTAAASGLTTSAPTNAPPAP